MLARLQVTLTIYLWRIWFVIYAISAKCAHKIGVKSPWIEDYVWYSLPHVKMWLYIACQLMFVGSPYIFWWLAHRNCWLHVCKWQRGICSYSVNTGILTFQQKRAFGICCKMWASTYINIFIDQCIEAEKCGVRFPCGGLAVFTKTMLDRLADLRWLAWEHAQWRIGYFATWWANRYQWPDN